MAAALEKPLGAQLCNLREGWLQGAVPRAVLSPGSPEAALGKLLKAQDSPWLGFVWVCHGERGTTANLGN